MIISSINNVDLANKIFISPLTFVDSNEFDGNSENFRNNVIRYDALVHDYIVLNKFEELRLAFESGELLESSFFQNDDSETNYSNVGITDYSDYPFYSDYPLFIYPYSKNFLFKNVYTFVLPSLVNLYFSYMKETNRIKQIGNGLGKAFYVKAVPFTQEDFQIINSKSLDYNDVVNLMSNVVSQYSQANADIEYLMSLVKNYEKINSELLQKVYEYEQSLINVVNYTWR
jgi:hypothetical protein